MKILINRFGPIDRFEYDFSKNIIVTYGDNNIGKSYSMQLVYLFLKYLYSSANMPLFYSNFWDENPVYWGTSFSPQSKFVEEKVKEFSKASFQNEDITELIRKEAERLISERFVRDFINGCKNTFGNYEDLCTKNPTLSMSCDELRLDIHFATNTLSFQFDLPKIELKKSENYYHKTRRTENKHTIYYKSGIEMEAISALILKEALEAQYLFMKQILKDVGTVYFLPASRSGIYSGMSAFSGIIAELSKNRATLTKKIELPGTSEPTADYFLRLSSIRSKENNEFEEFYHAVEQNILKGSVSINKKKNTLVYKSNDNGQQYEMTEVSSMVSEISPIVAFFKYIIFAEKASFKSHTARSIVFIEEPEAHLHPENQIKLAEIFSRLSNSGTKLVMSSHSNYIFNKFNNLVLSKALPFEKYEPILLKKGENGSISKLIQIDELGAVDENFADVSYQLLEEREALIAKLNFND